MDYTSYPDIELWGKAMPHRGGDTYREVMINTGGAAFDVDKFIHSEIGALKIRDARTFILNPREDSPEVYAYWRSLGATKTIHTDPETGVRWCCYVPDGLSGPAPMDVNICIEPYITETFGTIQYVVTHGGIFVSPYTHGIPDVLRVVECMKVAYPVDASRVYITGFSYGGIMATWLGYANPKVFAAVNCIGTIEPIFYPGQVEAMSEKERPRRAFGDIHAPERMSRILDDVLEASRYRMPVLINTGLTELRTTVPISKTPDVPLGGWLGICKMRGFNAMMRAIGHREFFYDEFDRALEEGDPTERGVGIFFDSTSESVINGVRHYCGDMLVDGEPLMRYIVIENLPHEPSPTSPAFTWEYLSRFSRNTETGELIIQK